MTLFLVRNTFNASVMTVANKIKLIVIVVAFLAFSLESTALEVEYHPSSNLQLGFGFDPNNPNTLFAVPALKSGKDINIDTNGIVEGQIEISEVQSRKQLLKKLGMSASVEAHSAFFRGSASMSQTEDYSFDSSSMIWVASVKITFGRYRRENPQASTSLLATKQSRVKEVFGEHIVTQELRGAIASVVFEAKGLSTNQKKALSKAISASYSGGAAGGSAKANYKKTVEEIRETSEITMRMYVKGGPGTDFLSRFISGSNDIESVREALASYVKNTTSNNAKPISFSTSPISQFRKQSHAVAPNLSEERVWELFETYASLTGIVRHIDKFIGPTNANNDYLRFFVSDTDRKNLQSLKSLYDDSRAGVRDAAISLIEGKKAKMPDVSGLPRIEWPKISPAPQVIVPPQDSWNKPSLKLGPFISKDDLTRGQVMEQQLPLLIIGKSGSRPDVSFIQGDGKIPLDVTFWIDAKDDKFGGLNPFDRKDITKIESLVNSGHLHLPPQKILFENHSEMMFWWISKILKSGNINSDDIIGITTVPIKPRYLQETKFSIEIKDEFGRIVSQHLSAEWK